MSRNSKVSRNQRSAPPKGGRNSKAPGHRGPSSPKEDLIPRSWRAVVGTHAIKEALAVHSKMAKVLWVKQGYESSQDLRDIVDFAQAKKVKLEVLAEGRIDKISGSHQGACLYLDGAPVFDTEKLKKLDKSAVILLDGIEDPHNLGAIVRTAWLTGVQGVIIPEDRAVGLTPTVHKVACGGVEHVPVEETNRFTNVLEELKAQGYWVFGLSHKAERTIFDLQLPEKVVWAIGAEDKGLRVTTERLCDELVSIPQASAGASYNASVATAIALTETMRQHTHCGNHKKTP